MDSSNNYFAYRKILKTAKYDTSPDKAMIPVFSLVMRDLNYLFNSIPSQNQKGYLNFAVIFFSSSGKFINY